MSGTVLVTGASGLVGSPTVRQFAADGWQVVATAHRSKVDGQPPGVTIAKVDLTDRADVERLMSEVAPDVIAHLAAFIPPQIYRDPAMGRRVNVDATRSLVRAAEAQPKPARFVHASSGSLYGPRNPHRVTDRLTKDTPLRPNEIYGIQKLEAEEIVRSSSLDWVSLRIGGVMSADPAAMPFSADTLYFGGSLAIDQRCHTVDNRDVASAFVAAATADVVGEILLIGGDDTHLLRQRDLLQAMAAARGLVGSPLGRPGDPDSDDTWYPYGDWMDVTRAQQALSFHHHPWPEMLAEMRAAAGWKYYPTRLFAPVARAVLKRQAVYRDAPGSYADPLGAIRARFGELSFESDGGLTPREQT
jgi:nucleoside-diphosphate-sugar epimerase